MLAQKRNKIMYKNIFSNFFLFPIGHLTHPSTSKVFLDFFIFFLFTWPLSQTSSIDALSNPCLVIIPIIMTIMKLSSNFARSRQCSVASVQYMFSEQIGCNLRFRFAARISTACKSVFELFSSSSIIIIVTGRVYHFTQPHTKVTGFITTQGNFSSYAGKGQRRRWSVHTFESG